MSYKLYTDRNEDFTCEVAVKNASIKGSIARLIVESDGLNLVFNGKLTNGKCIIPVKRLKGLLEESVKGKMHLEVIVEDTYFRPWESEFVVEEHTSVKVKVNEQKEIVSSGKPTVEVKSILTSKKPVNEYSDRATKKSDVYIPLREIVVICNRFGIKKTNAHKRKSDLTHILKEYFISNPEYNNKKTVILHGLSKLMK